MRTLRVDQQYLTEVFSNCSSSFFPLLKCFRQQMVHSTVLPTADAHVFRVEGQEVGNLQEFPEATVVEIPPETAHPAASIATSEPPCAQIAYSIVNSSSSLVSSPPVLYLNARGSSGRVVAVTQEMLLQHIQQMGPEGVRNLLRSQRNIPPGKRSLHAGQGSTNFYIT